MRNTAKMFSAATSVKGKTMRQGTSVAGLCAAVLGLFFLSVHKTSAQTELRVLVSDGVKPAVEELTPQMERSAGRRLALQFDSSNRLKDRILAGETFDVAILSSDVIDDLIKQGKIAAGTRTGIARTGMGVGVRAGAAKPDISTPEALKRTLLNAKSISFNPSGASAPHIRDIFNRLGITEAVKSKLILDPEPGNPQRNVAAGKAELVMTLIPEIKFFPGLDLAGPIPAALQSYISFSAGIATNTQNAVAAKALIKFLAGPAAASALKAKGEEPF